LSAGATSSSPAPAARAIRLRHPLLEADRNHRITHAAAYRRRSRACRHPRGEHDNSSLRVVATGASICPIEIERRFLARWGGDCVQQVYA